MKLSLLTGALAAVLLPHAAVAQGAAARTYSAKVVQDPTSKVCTLVQLPQPAQLHKAVFSAPNGVHEQVRPQVSPHDEEVAANAPLLIEIFGQTEDAVAERLAMRCAGGLLPTANNIALESVGTMAEAVPLTPKVKKIVDSGDPKNRIDVVFMGDGYTAAEETKFYDDITRLTHEMFTGDTFSQYLPLFNIWAVYVPSNESGIGKNDVPKDTAFGLYRGECRHHITSGLVQSNH